MAKKMKFIPPWGPYIEVEDVPPTGSAAPDAVGTPPQIYKYEDDDTIRGEGPGTAGQFNPAAYAPTPYSPRVKTPFGGGGGGGGGGNNRSGGGSTGTMPGRLPLPGTMGGGGGMAIRQQHANLDPNVWGSVNPSGQATSAYSQALGSAQGYGGAAAGAAGQLQGVNAHVGAAPSTLYDRYQSLLMDPQTAMMNNPAVQYALQQAQQAAQRQLSAGRMRNSGNALAELSGVTTGNLMQQFGNLADIYGEGARTELSRWDTQANRYQNAAQIGANALGKAGDLYLGAGDLGIKAGMIGQQSSQVGLDQQKLELARVQSGIQSPTEQYRQAQRAAANPFQPYTTANLNGSPGFSYGGASPYNLTYTNWLMSNWGL